MPLGFSWFVYEVANMIAAGSRWDSVTPLAFIPIMLGAYRVAGCFAIATLGVNMASTPEKYSRAIKNTLHIH